MVCGGATPNAVAFKLKSFEGLIIGGLKLVRRPAKPNRPTAWQLQTVEAPAADPFADLM
jgi:hypothetical protein